METLPILYRAAVYLKRTRREILGEPRETWELAARDADRIAAAHPAQVILVLKTDKWPINAGNFYLDWILK